MTATSLELRLLLYCLVPNVRPNRGAVAVDSLLSQVDWSVVSAGIAGNLIAPIAHEALAPLSLNIPSSVWGEIDQLHQRVRLHAMRVLAAASHLRKRYLEKLGIKHAFLKGAFVSRRHYLTDYSRVSRDVDVLVEPTAYHRLVEMLVADGYQVTNDIWPDRVGHDLGVLCKYASTVELKSPNEITVEVHRSLDSNECTFSTRALLRNGKEISVAGQSWAVLEEKDEVLYLLFHHSRHGWAQLHWCADLLRIEELFGRYKANISALAKEMGLTNTLSQALLLAEELRAIAYGEEMPKRKPSGFLEDVLSALENMQPSVAYNRHAVKPLNSSVRDPNFAYEWQKSVRYRFCTQLKRLGPSLTDYESSPFPLRWHFIYPILKPLRLLKRRHWRI